MVIWSSFLVWHGTMRSYSTRRQFINNQPAQLVQCVGGLLFIITRGITCYNGSTVSPLNLQDSYSSYKNSFMSSSCSTSSPLYPQHPQWSFSYLSVSLARFVKKTPTQHRLLVVNKNITLPDSGGTLQPEINNLNSYRKGNHILNGQMNK